MKHWQETAKILDRLVALEAEGQGAAVASVIRIAGSAYRRPGARFLIAADGTTMGGISGGCLEEDVRQTALQVIADGECRLLHYETGEDDDALWGLGLGCNGMVDVFVQPATAGGFAAAANGVREMLAGKTMFSLATLVTEATATGKDTAEGEGTTEIGAAREAHGAVLPAPPGTLSFDTSPLPGLDADLLRHAAAALEGRSGVIDVDGMQLFVETFTPPPYLIICGASDDAMPLARMAARVGYRVAVLDHRATYLTTERFPRAWMIADAAPDDALPDLPVGADTSVVLKTHNVVRDKAWARRFLDTEVPFIGLLGPADRCQEIADEARPEDQVRIYGPVGLDLGSEGPEQIGLSIVAELMAVRSKRAAGHLRHRETSIHA